MQEKQRWFSGFDVAVVLLVLVGVLVWLFVLNREPAVEQPTFEGRAVYRIEVTFQPIERLQAVQVGDWIQEGTQNLPIGEVIGIEIRPHRVWVDSDETQTIWWEEVEDRYDMILLIETDVRETEREIWAGGPGGEHVIRGGSTIHFSGPGFAFSGATILGLER